MKEAGTRRTVLTLEVGRSARSTHAFVEGGPIERLSVGSSGRSDWRIHAPGVKARHAQLVWNGRVLRVECQREPGSVLVGGRAVAHRIEVPCGAQIRLGQAVLRCDVEAPRDLDDSDADVATAQFVARAGADPLAEPPSACERTEADPPADGVRASATLAMPPGGPDNEPMTLGRRGPAGAAVTTRPGWRMRRRLLVVAVLATCAGGLAALFAVSSGIVARGERGASTSTPGATGGAPSSAGPAVAASAPQLEPPSRDSADAGAADPSRAAVLLVEGHQVEALRAYRLLSAAHPEARVYADTARLLEHQIGSRCASLGGGPACDAL